jgi:steroid delta-isomerase-like uncharacterized protein
MSIELNKTNVLRIPLEVFNQGNLAVADEVMAADYIEHAAVPPGLPPSLAGFKIFISALRAAFPDFQYTVEDVIAEGDKVVVRLTARGTQNGEFLGLPASGKQATWSEIHIADMADGKLVEHWVVQDQLGMMQQLGFVPVSQG